MAVISKTDPTAFPIEVDPEQQRMRGTTRLGNKPFDVPYVSQIDGNLWQGGCAQGLWLPTQFDHLISLYPWEQYTMRRQLKSVSFHWLYDTDEGDPPEIVHAIANWVSSCIFDGPTLVHCQAGLNRSSLVAALVLIQRGRTVDEAISLIRAKRSDACLSNEAFERWLRYRHIR